MINQLSRFTGCLLGLACGDAIGATVEFRTRGSFEPLTDMRGGGVFNLQPGQWTDDTTMALCLAASLSECGTFDAKDQMEKYCRWMNTGYMSSTGSCFDIGNATQQALNSFLITGEPYSGSTDPYSAGNGCIMRLAPIPLFFFPDKTATLSMSSRSAMTTHGAKKCIEASALFGGMLHEALNGASKQDILLKHSVTDILSPDIQAIANGDYFTKPANEIFGTGYVAESLEAALWCFWKTDNFRDAILMAANLGDDADTTAAICGQISGAYYGEQGIPEHWLTQIAMRDTISNLAEQLFFIKPR